MIEGMRCGRATDGHQAAGAEINKARDQIDLTLKQINSRHVTKVTAEKDDTCCYLPSSLRLPGVQFGRTETNEEA